MRLLFDQLQASLDYGEEMHQSIKNFSPQQGLCKGVTHGGKLAHAHHDTTNPEIWKLF